MNLFVADKLNPVIFSADIRQGTHDLSDILAAAIQTTSPQIESTHFLFGAAAIKDGLTERFIHRLGLSVEQWQAGLMECALKKPGVMPPAHLTRDVLHETSIGMLEAAKEYCNRYTLPEITETVLLLCALGHLTEETKQLFSSVDIDVNGWRGELELLLMPVEPIRVLTTEEPGTIDQDMFSPGAKKVLQLMQGEAEALGYTTMDPRHLAIALLTHEGGVTQFGLFQQGLRPRKVQEILILNLKAKARRIRSSLVLTQETMQPMLQSIFILAGELAGKDHTGVVHECHLLLAFLDTRSMARHILEDEKVDLRQLKSVAEQYDLENEEEEEDLTLADIDTVRQRLLGRLVGQDQAIERILPAVQRMRFGFTVPERPVGVFLFCGQSGSGKTELAKELARAVYGSEENLIFMEMGQFNSPESMNIFVGSPPGYVGYGEGKLTNGLRDKPQSVVLFDEVEKAHPRVLDALLRFLDEGRIDDPAGPVRDGSKCIVILTSNIGADRLSELARELEGNPQAQSIIRQELRKEFKKEEFRVEFLNRVDELILFRTLNQTDYTGIAQRLLKSNLARLEAEKEVTVVASDGVAAAIGTYCGSIDEGARATARLIQSVVITPTINFIVGNNLTPPVKVKVGVVIQEQPVEQKEGEKKIAVEPLGIVELPDVDQP